jgi:hypothetical protein
LTSDLVGPYCSSGALGLPQHQPLPQVVQESLSTHAPATWVQLWLE